MGLWEDLDTYVVLLGGKELKALCHYIKAINRTGSRHDSCTMTVGYAQLYLFGDSEQE